MDLFIYLLKSVSILAMFYFVYVLALRSDTHFESNRHFLIAGVLAAVILPFVTFTQINWVEIPAITSEIPSSTGMVSSQPSATDTAIDWTMVTMVVYVSIMLVMAIRLGYQIVQLFTIFKGATKRRCDGYTYVESPKVVAPFSFFNYIVFNPQMHERQELEMILKHEQVHAKQKHSADLLLANFLTVLQWINPFAWWYKSLMAENLEFIADRQTVAKIDCDKQYQLALVKNSTNPQNFTITNHFYQSFNHLKVFGLRIKMPFQNGRIKKRIVMLNKSNSDKKSKWKLAIILPLLGMFMWSFNVEEVTEYKVADSMEPPINYTINAQTTDGQLNAIEDAFLKEQRLKVLFKDRERNAQNELITLSVDAAYNLQKPVYKYLTLSGKDRGPIGDMLLDMVDGELRISDLESKMVLRATQNGLVADALDVTPKETPKKEELFGDDPLYIINEKPFKTEDLPEGKTIVTDGGITALDKEEGKKEYGEAGKDGVLVINGLARFEDNPVKQEIEKSNPRKAQGVNSTTTKKDILVVIKSSMNNAELAETVAYAKDKHGLDIVIKDVVYNSDNQITAIELTYAKGDSKGSYHVSSDDGPIDDIFISINENGGVGIGNDFAQIKKNMQIAKGYAERSKAMALRQKELAVRGEARKKEMEARKEGMALAMKARQNEMKARSSAMRAKQKALAAEKRAMAYSYGSTGNTNYNYRGSHHDRVVVEADMSDAQLALLKEKLSAKGIDFSYKRVKRNSDGLITSIKLTLNNNKGSSSNTNINTNDDEPIETIVMEY
ncbi:MAG: M56 family metallopeptidase [Gilvibacter sp.]